MSNEMEDITPEQSVATIYLDTTVIPPAEGVPDPMADAEAIQLARDAAVEKLVTEFDFTEEMARTIVGG